MRLLRRFSLLALLAALIAFAPPAEADAPPPDVPLIVLAFDGASAREVERLMDAGKLPNLAKLRDEGGYRRLATTNPAQSPVSWAAMTTGVNPGRTGIYDFLRRTYPKRGGVGISIGVGEAKRTPFLTPATRGGLVFGAGVLGALLGVLLVLLLRGMGSSWGRKKRAEALITLPAAVLAVAALAVVKFVPQEVIKAKNLRGGEPFWSTLDRSGIACAALEAPMAFPADRMEQGCCLSGLGTPDVQGSWGTFALWTDDLTVPGVTETGGVTYYVNSDKPFDVVLAGPPDPLLTSAERDEIRKRADAEMYRRQLAFEWGRARKRVSETEEALIRLEGRLTVTLGARLGDGGVVLALPDGSEMTARSGQWSALLPVTFDLTPLASLTERAQLPATVRFLYTWDAESQTTSLLATPVQFDPARPLPANVRISSPPELAQSLAADAGTFESLGWPELTNPVKDGVLSDHAFLAHIRLLMDGREERLRATIAKNAYSCVFAMFGETDRVQHAFWRHIDPKSPVHDPDASPAFAGEIDRIYQEMDRIVGEHLENNRVLVVSDHGFAPFRRGVNLNNFLRAQGFQVAVPGAGAGNKVVGDLFGGKFFEDVDWQKTRAYAMGLGNIYLNLDGREPDGVVAPEDVDALLVRIRDKLLALKDEDGTKVVRDVYFGKDLYEGDRADEAPDLVVGFEWGYRVSWQTCLGNTDPDVIIDNTQSWSGDHCSVDPSLVPGVLFANFPLAPDTQPTVLDVAPTILDLFGVTREAHEGESLLAPR